MTNKQMIKESYGSYCDTDKLVDDMMALLSKYGHRNSEHGVCTILDSFFANKAPLIRMLAQSPNYKGDLRIIRKETFARDCVERDILNFIQGFRKDDGIKNCIIKYEDEHGKTIHDYMRTGTRHMTLKQMNSATNLFASEAVKQFDLYTGATMESVKRLQAFNTWMDSFQRHNHTSLHSDWEYDGVRCAAGMKTSRAFNRVCTHYGVNKWDKYNKEFAKYADMVTGKDREMQFVISVNPLDYLTMSFGKSWASCHTIDKRNVRRMENGYSGMYCNGTLSYMMDGSSIITYVLDELGENMHEIGKVYRNMFHVNVNSQLCIQGRIYPQGNDGSTDLYKKFRFIMQDELTPLFGLEENKWKSRSVGGEDAHSTGNHYQDYYNYNSCKTFYPSAKEGQSLERIYIGHIGICPRCGREYRSSEYLSHDYDCEIPEESHTETEVEATTRLTLSAEPLTILRESIANANESVPEHLYEFRNASDIVIHDVATEGVSDRNMRSYRVNWVYGDFVRGRSHIVHDDDTNVEYAHADATSIVQEILNNNRERLSDLEIRYERLANTAENSITTEDIGAAAEEYINNTIHAEFVRVANANEAELAEAIRDEDVHEDPFI